MNISNQDGRKLMSAILELLDKPRSIAWVQAQFPQHTQRVPYTVYNAVKRGLLKSVTANRRIGQPSLFVRPEFEDVLPEVEEDAAADDFTRPVVKRVVPAGQAVPFAHALGPRSVFDLGARFTPAGGLQGPGDDWRAMLYAPLDGTRVELLIRHRSWWAAYKLGPAETTTGQWQAACVGHWIDHNGGGWCWEGLAGQPVGWRPLQATTAQAAPEALAQER